MPKRREMRITLSYLRKIEVEREGNEKWESIVRELEMLEDTVPQPPGYPMQFWQDVRLYGLREALLYLGNQDGVVKDCDQFRQLETRIDQVCKALNKE